VAAAADARRLPKAPPGIVPAGIAAESLARRIDAFLASRGYTPPGGGQMDGHPQPEAPPPASAPATPHQEKPADFVCEEDVRLAVRQGRKIVIGDHSIVTPAARDMGEQHRVFVQASLPR
jgi:hypothetical protein